MSSRAVIAADSLAEDLVATRPPVLLDVRWTLAGADRQAYRQAHVPGAVFIDLDRDLAGPPGPGGRHPLPDPASLQRTWRAAGIDDDSAVVAYDGGDGMAAARAWWLLRWSGLTGAVVLDGGFAAWTADPGRPLESGDVAAPSPGTITIHPGGMPAVDIDRAAALAADPGAVLLDARAPARFRGDIEPIDPVGGHIPGAVNLPYADLRNADGTFRPVAELDASLSAAGLRDDATRQAASCGSGVSACVLILAGELVGVPLALYPGSYSQWCAAGRAVAVGD